MNEELCFLSAADLRARVGRKDVLPVEITHGDVELLRVSALFEASQDLLGRWPAVAEGTAERA